MTTFRFYFARNIGAPITTAQLGELPRICFELPPVINKGIATGYRTFSPVSNLVHKILLVKIVRI